MLPVLKRTITHTAVYSLGNIAAKLIGVILLPVYTTHISLADYGVLGIVEVTVFILSQVLMLGQGQAYMRFYNAGEYKPFRERLLFSAAVVLIGTGLLLQAAGHAVLPHIVGDTALLQYLYLGFMVVGFRILTTFFLSVLRSQERPVLYAVSALIKIAVTLVLTIIFVVSMNLGVTGILRAMVIGDAVMFFILLPVMAKRMKASFSIRPLKAAMLFGMPLVINSLAGMILNMGDRYLLKILVDYQEVGLYNLGYKIAGVLNMVLIQSFLLSIRPISYSLYGKDGDTRFYSKILTYFVFVLVWSGLAVSLFSREVVHFFARSPDFWPAYNIVPLIIVGYIFSGARSVVNIGLLLKHRTRSLALVTGAAAVVNIALNLLLIPQYGMYGAAIATILSFIILYVLTHVLAQRALPVPYEHKKLLIMLASGAVLYLVPVYACSQGTAVCYIAKITAISMFPVILYIAGFYEPVELERMKALVKKFVS